MDSRLEQAKKWAEGDFDQAYIHAGPRAAAEVIQSLPNHWIDAEKLREVIEEARLLIRDGEPEIILNDLSALLPAPRPRTLADMTPEEREACQWMQCTVEGRADDTFVIVTVGEYATKALSPDGPHVVSANNQVTPLPDLPRLEWPGGGVEDDPLVDGEPIMMPRPEDVKPGDYWLVRIGGRLSPVAAERDHRFEDYPWTVLEGRGGDHYPDAYVTLISRLVPEHKENT